MANNFVQEDLSTITVQPPITSTVPTLQLPTRPLLPFPSVPVVIGNSPLKVVPSTTTTVDNTSGQNGIPLPLLTVQAVQTPVKQQSYTNCNVTISFTRNVADTNYNHVNIWFVGYHGSTTPQLMSAGTTSPLNFLCDATQETVKVYAQTVNALGESAPVTFAATCSVTLSGIVAAPPAPTISQSLVGTPTGFQFGFNQVVLPAGDQEVIKNYNIYRSATANTFASASLLGTVVPNAELTGAITYTDTINSATGAAYYYWVTAVNTAGFESTATAAQTGVVAGSIGSLPPSISTPFTLTTTSTSVTITTSPSCQFTRADGTKVMIGQTSTACTGLPTGNDVFFFPYWRESDQSLQFVQNTDATIPSITSVKFTAASDQYIETTTVGSIPTAFSVELWMQGSATGALFDYSAPQVVGSTTASVLQGFVTSGGEVEVAVHNGSAWTTCITSGASVLDTCWHHVVFTYAAGVGNIYVDGFNTSDGVTLWTNASMGTIATTSGSWHFGVVAGLAGATVTSTLYNSFNLSHISLYTSALSGIQAAAHQSAFVDSGETIYLSELTYDSAANLWKLSETSGHQCGGFHRLQHRHLQSLSNTESERSGYYRSWYANDCVALLCIRRVAATESSQPHAAF